MFAIIKSTKPNRFKGGIEMILAEKIIKLRKQKGWSQEELAMNLGVSRQSVSKWESMTSIPDLDKIMKMSEIFEVSTDYLLKENIVDEKQYTENIEIDETKIYTISLEEANEYMNLANICYRKIALAVSMCVLSPVLLLFLKSASEYTIISLKENIAVAIGSSILLIIIAYAVVIFILYGMKLGKYEYLEKEKISTEYGVSGIIKSKRDAYENNYKKGLVFGIFTCIISAVPLFLSSSVKNEFFTICAICITLIMIAIGVNVIIKVVAIWGTYQKLLEEEDYTREKKQEAKNNEALTGFYWCFITAVYLAISFYTNKWGNTWIIWPVSGVLFAAVLSLKNMLDKNKKI